MRGSKLALSVRRSADGTWECACYNNSQPFVTERSRRCDDIFRADDCSVGYSFAPCLARLQGTSTATTTLKSRPPLSSPSSPGSKKPVSARRNAPSERSESTIEAQNPSPPRGPHHDQQHHHSHRNQPTRAMARSRNQPSRAAGGSRVRASGEGSSRCQNSTKIQKAANPLNRTPSALTCSENLKEQTDTPHFNLSASIFAAAAPHLWCRFNPLRRKAPLEHLS